MTGEAGHEARPRVLMLVLNPVEGDSRVQKVGWSAARAGWDTTVLGVSPSGRRDGWRLGSARVVRVGVGSVWDARRLRLRDRSGGGRVRHAGTGFLAQAMRMAGFARRVRLALLRRLHRVALESGPEAVFESNPARLRRSRQMVWRVVARDADWRHTQPQLLDAERAFTPVIDEVDPDLLHAHDYSTIGVAVRAAHRAWQRGRRIRVVYDAHEYLPGVRAQSPVWHRALLDLERWALTHTDAVIAVSSELAEMLRDRHELAVPPRVVANAPLSAPMEGVPGELEASVRERAGLAPDVPILVYSGAVAPQRGVATMVEALPLLPGVHAVVVAGAGRHVDRLTRLAGRLGVGERLHVLPYVAPHLVPDYLASATIGVIPILHQRNHEIALVTKYFEYMRARLPIVVSDVRAMAARTRELGNGEVFVAGDVESFVAAVRAVLADRESYIAAYTEAVLGECTWEQQAEVLMDVYAGLVDQAPAPGLGMRGSR